MGFILLRSELVPDDAPVPRLNLEMSVADSQGGIGHILGQALLNELAARGLPDKVACVMSHVVVDPADPAFGQPTKPIGPFYTKEESDQRAARNGWTMIEDSGRGYRRVVASPEPLRIVEGDAIRALVDAGYVVIAVGGGGIAVVETAPGQYRGVEAVIDKDRASALLAASLDIPLLVLSTGVERVAVHFRQPDERWVDRMGGRRGANLPGGGRVPEGIHGPQGRGGDPLPRAWRPGSPHHHPGRPRTGDRAARPEPESCPIRCRGERKEEGRDAVRQGGTL